MKGLRADDFKFWMVVIAMIYGIGWMIGTNQTLKMVNHDRTFTENKQSHALRLESQAICVDAMKVQKETCEDHINEAFVIGMTTAIELFTPINEEISE